MINKNNYRYSGYDSDYDDRMAKAKAYDYRKNKEFLLKLFSKFTPNISTTDAKNLTINIKWQLKRISFNNYSDLNMLIEAAEGAPPELLPFALAEMIDKIDLDAQDDEGRIQLLHMAVKHSTQRAIHFLLSHEKNNINAQDSFGQTALHLAVKIGFEVIVWALLEEAKGIDVNIKDDQGKTALHRAVEKNTCKQREKVVRLLLKAGTNINAQDFLGQTALQVAITEGISKEIIQLLLAQKMGNINKPDYKGNTPFLQYLDFCQRHEIEITEEMLTAFLERDPNLHFPNHEGTTAAKLIVSHPYLSNALKGKVLYQNAPYLLLNMLEKTNFLTQAKTYLPTEIRQNILLYLLLPYFSKSILPKTDIEAITYMSSKIDECLRENKTLINTINEL